MPGTSPGTSSPREGRPGGASSNLTEQLKDLEHRQQERLGDVVNKLTEELNELRNQEIDVIDSQNKWVASLEKSINTAFESERSYFESKMQELSGLVRPSFCSS